MQRANSGDWLILQLQALIDVAFKMATGTVEALRPMGLQLLKVGRALQSSTFYIPIVGEICPPMHRSELKTVWACCRPFCGISAMRRIPCWKAAGCWSSRRRNLLLLSGASWHVNTLSAKLQTSYAGLSCSYAPHCTSQLCCSFLYC